MIVDELGKAVHKDKFQKFLDEYGGLSFSKVKFRPSAQFTTDFGLDNTFNDLRLHVAIDRGHLPQQIYAPFNLKRVEVNAAGMSVWGIQLRLLTDYGFEVRVAHIEHLPDETMKMIKTGLPVKAGTYLCDAGSAGISTGIHTHTEIVSYGETSSVLDQVLSQKCEGKEKIPYSLSDVKLFLEKNRLNLDAEKVYLRELHKKRISFINSFLCKRRDYFYGRVCTFYNSKTLFGM